MNRWVYANSRREAIVTDNIGPYTFGVTIVNHPDSLPLDLTKLRKYIIKHKHSHMSFELGFETNTRIRIRRETMYWRTTNPACGTIPERNVTVGIDRSTIGISSSGEAFKNRYVACGTRMTGRGGLV